MKCTRCNIEKSDDRFALCKSVHNGITYATRRKVCKECTYEKAKIKYNQDIESSRLKQRERYASKGSEINEKKRARRKRNKDKYSITDRAYNESHRKERRLSVKKYAKSHPEKVSEWRLKRQRKSINEVSDEYIKSLLYLIFGLKRNQIPQKLIESYREQIKIKRLIKSKKNENTSTS